MSLLQDQELWSQMKQMMLSLKPTRPSLRSGIHEFQHRGRSLEFAEYREYRTGEDLRDLDWKVYARSDRYYLRQRDSHTPARVMILLDDSSSMRMQSEGARMSKLRQALLMVFGLSFILQRQGDPFSFHALSMNKPSAEARSSKRALRNLMLVLETLEKQESLPEDMEQHWPVLKNRSMDHLFCISDFMLPKEKLEGWLDGFLTMAPEIHCLQILDPLESGEGPQPSMVLDLEQPGQKRRVSADEWEHYLENMKEHQQWLGKACRQRNIRLRSIQTDQPAAASIRVLMREKEGRFCRFRYVCGFFRLSFFLFLFVHHVCHGLELFSTGDTVHRKRIQPAFDSIKILLQIGGGLSYILEIDFPFNLIHFILNGGPHLIRRTL